MTRLAIAGGIYLLLLALLLVFNFGAQRSWPVAATRSPMASTTR